MASVDNLPGDQRAVLQLVLGRGRSYDQIARLLSINPESVRERALAALDALGPETRVPADTRGLITDYLLGQLPEGGEIDRVRDLLAHSPSERAWARVVSSELAPLAGDGLPEIPTETTASRAPAAPEPVASEPAASAPAERDASAPAAAPALGSLDPSEPAATAEAVRERSRRRDRRGREDAFDEDGGRPRSSRLGGAVVIALTVVIVAVVLFFVLRGGSSPAKHSAAAKSSSTTAASASSSATTSSGSSTSAKVVAQINLTPPSGSSKAAGIAEVLDEGSSDGIAIVAQDVPANSTKPPNAYAVWLYNSPTDATILGFVNPGVGSNGRLSTAGPLPSNASHYKQLIVTVETTAKPTKPGPIILQGTLTGI